MHLPLNTPQFFFDDALIAHSQRLTRRWLPAKIYPDPILRPDQPWEGRCIGPYGTVLPDPAGGWRMYYNNFSPAFTFKKAGEKVRIAPCLMLARSDDGITWHKPALGQQTFEGSDTNMVANSGRHLDGASVMHEPQDNDRPYKMIGFSFENLDPMWNESFGLYTRHSRDGIAWSPQPAHPCLRAGDRTNLVPTRWQGKYLIYTRAFPGENPWNGGRAIFRSESDDFASWTAPELSLAMDLGDDQDVEFYGMATFERHGWLIGLLEYWRSDADMLELHLAVSRDGRNWIRPAVREPFIANEYDWNRTWVTCFSNGPIILNEQMVFYFGGRFAAHHWDTFQHHGVIGAASLPLDRFCAIEGKHFSVGYFETVPLTWPGGELHLNADCRIHYTSHPGACNGHIRVEVLDEDGAALPDWSGDNAGRFTGNTHMRGKVLPGPVMFPNDRRLDTLRGQTLRLRFHLHHARLFTVTAHTEA